MQKNNMKCPKCRNTLSHIANFCHHCGYALYSKAYEAESTTVFEAERKRVTALFSDLTGYTSLTNNLDPEEVKAITSSIFKGARNIIDKYEGFIERFEGDGFLALFGVPKSNEDDPIRAIRAACEIHELVEALSPKFKSKVGRDLSMHSGINTGLAVTADANPIKGTYGITGAAINEAARLSDLATAGAILVGPEGHRAAQSHFTFKPYKAKDQPFPVYQLISERTVESGASHKVQVFSEMVGRDQELARLESQIHKAVKGKGSVVNVFGEPGIGKSRLLAELRKQDVIKQVTFLEGRSISIGANLSYHPIIDLFKHWSEITEDDTTAVASNKLKMVISKVCGDDADEVFPFVATLMGMKLSGRQTRGVDGIEGEALEKLIFKNLRQLLIRSSELIPIVIVMEDLHWADTTSLELIESLFKLALTHRIVFINVFRPGYWQTDDRRVETLPEWLPEIDFVELSLMPLDKQVGEILVNNILQVEGLRYSIKQQIVDRTGGNPYFIEEVVRALIDDKTIVKTDTGLRVTERIDSAVIPPTINDVIIARIDRLDEVTRELVKIASVIGRSFFDRLIKHVADFIDDVDDRLTYLKDVQIIRDRIRMQELEHLFKHALAQEVVYASILIEQRKELHLKVAQSIERLFSERLHEFFGMLAFHYSKAGAIEKAEEYMMRAGEEALRSSASSEAVQYFLKALLLYQNKYKDDAEPNKLALFEKNISLALYNKGRWSEAVKYLDSVLERWGTPLPKKGPLGILRLIRDMLVLMKAVYWKLPNSKKTPEERDIEIHELHYRAAEALAFVDNIRQFQVTLADFRRIVKLDLTKIPKLWGYWAGVAAMFSVGRVSSFNLSHRLLEASSRFRVHGDVVDRIRHSAFSCMVHHYQGTWKEIQDLDWKLTSTSIEVGELFHSSEYLWFSGLVRGEQGDFEHLKMIIDRLFEMGETYDYTYSLVLAHILKADYFIRRNSAGEALSEAEKSIFYSRQLNSELNEMMGMAYKAMAQQVRGDEEGALETVSQASEIYKTQSWMVLPAFVAPFLVARFFIAVAELRNAIGSRDSLDVAGIRKYTYEAGKAAMWNSRKYAPYRTKILRLMGEYYWLIGKQGQTRKWWGKAIHEGEKLGARSDLSRTYFEVGKHLLGPNNKYKDLNGIGARGFFAKARTYFEDMDMKQDLKELDKIDLV
jgi:class 3 adenylate cyclase/tetratricopeptide (TPR) repeat protein